MKRTPFMVLVALAAMTLMAMTGAAAASCSCECVNGHAENVCQSSIDLKQLCTNSCAPSIPDYGAPRNNYSVLPPLGTTKCTNEQVMNPYTHQYETKTLCH